MPSPIIIALLAVAAAVAYFLFGRSSSPDSSATATPLNGAVKAAGAAESAGRDFVKAMELAVSVVIGSSRARGQGSVLAG